MSISRMMIVGWLFMALSHHSAGQVVSKGKSEILVSPMDCEANSATVDFVNTQAGKEGLIILIARLGDNERSPTLNRRRLVSVKQYLVKTGWQRPERTVVAAEGGRVQGYGRVEAYVAGELVAVLAVKRNGELRLTSCAA